MRGVIRSVLVLLGLFMVACLPARQVAAELPPDIMAEAEQRQAEAEQRQAEKQAERLIAKKDYGAAREALDKIVALQREHYITLSDQFHFMYARVALSEGSISIAIDSAKRYLSAAGTAGKFHKEALALLDESEQMMLPLEPEMVLIPAGRFRMGCLSNCEAMMDYAKPVHEVTIESFALSKYEVTFEEYARFTAATGRRPASDSGWGRGRRPVIDVSWEDAVAYTEWLSAHTGERYRLPSEAEWEYAARAGSGTVYSWGNEIGRGRANCNSCGSQWDNKKTAPVGSFSPNAWGLHDMHGNVMGVGTGLLARQLRGGACGRFGLGERRLLCARVSRRLMVLHTQEPPRRVPQLVLLRRTGLLQRFPYCPDAYSLNLHLFTSWGGPGGHCPPEVFCLTKGSEEIHLKVGICL